MKVNIKLKPPVIGDGVMCGGVVLYPNGNSVMASKIYCNGFSRYYQQGEVSGYSVSIEELSKAGFLGYDPFFSGITICIPAHLAQEVPSDGVSSDS